MLQFIGGLVLAYCAIIIAPRLTFALVGLWLAVMFGPGLVRLVPDSVWNGLGLVAAIGFFAYLLFALSRLFLELLSPFLYGFGYLAGRLKARSR